MKKNILLLLILGISFSGFTQISFEKGYLIDNLGTKTDCLIKNMDWRKNPVAFDYKLTETGEVKTGKIRLVKEFSVGDNIQYTRNKVQIDTSLDDLNTLKRNRNPEFKEVVIFLKTLVRGKASLYEYHGNASTRYFYNTADNQIKQLIYKRYLSEYNKIGKNERYKNQLWNDLKCKDININQVKSVTYQRRPLIQFFKKYHECNNLDFKDYTKKDRQKALSLILRPGINSASLSLLNNRQFSPREANFENEINFRFGVEAEFVLGFHKNKWAIIAEPTYQYFKSDAPLTPENNVNLTADYSSIELPIGIRHYFYLNNKSKLFVNGSIVLDFTKSSKIDFNNTQSFDIQTNNNLAFGLGYKYNNKYSIELRYLTDRELLTRNQPIWESKYKTLSLIFGYTIF